MINIVSNVDDRYSLALNQQIKYKYSIFNNPKFIELHSENYEKVLCYFLIENKTNSCKGIACFGVDLNNNIRSPLNGSFGGFQFSKNICLENKENFINLVLKNLDSFNPNSIEITFPPDIYNLENNTHQLSIFLRNNYLIKNVEINQFIDINTYDLDRSVKSVKKYEIKQCKKRNILFRELRITENELAYKIILNNSKRRKYKISMNWEDLKKMINTFPDNFFSFGLFDSNEMIASAICIKISEEILYVFFRGYKRFILFSNKRK